jgi:hypothetical protein
MRVGRRPVHRPHVHLTTLTTQFPPISVGSVLPHAPSTSHPPPSQGIAPRLSGTPTYLFFSCAVPPSGCARARACAVLTPTRPTQLTRPAPSARPTQGLRHGPRVAYTAYAVQRTTRGLRGSNVWPTPSTRSRPTSVRVTRSASVRALRARLCTPAPQAVTMFVRAYSRPYPRAHTPVCAVFARVRALMR